MGRCLLPNTNLFSGRFPVRHDEEGINNEQEQTLAHEASLVMPLMEKSVKLVLGNAWSVNITGSKVMITELYSKLLEEEILKVVNSCRLKCSRTGSTRWAAPIP